jgi:nitronate monooxygenase
MTKKPIGINIIVEKSSLSHEKKMREWLDIALEEGCRFVITALGNPTWVLKKVKEVGGLVYHDVINRKWAEKAIDYGVNGLICVNNCAGGHAGNLSARALYHELSDLGVPLVCAGGIGDDKAFVEALQMGYMGVQMGTRFIATIECREKDNYKQAIVKANEDDIVLTERVTGIPLSVIRTPYVERIGTKVGPLSRYLLKQSWSKKWMRLWYGLTAIQNFKRVSLNGGSSKDYWQAGKSVGPIHSIESVEDIIKKLVFAGKNKLNNKKNN